MFRAEIIINFNKRETVIKKGGRKGVKGAMGSEKGKREVERRERDRSKVIESIKGKE